MFLAYFDAAGDPNDQNRHCVSLAGLVAPEKNWRQLEKSWNKILRRYGLDKMHMTDFAARRKPYDKLDERERNECLATLAGIVKRAVVFGCAHCFTVKDWNEMMRPHFKTQWQGTRGWYCFLLHSVLKDIRQSVKMPKGEKMACIFDRDKMNAYAATCYYDTLIDGQKWADFYGAIKFVRDQDNKLEDRFVPIQAADMVAYEATRHYEDVMVCKKRAEPRKLFANLTANSLIRGVAHPRARLERIRGEWLAIQQELDRRGIDYDPDPNT